MAVRRVDTDKFSDAELAAKAVATEVENLRLSMITAKNAATRSWIGLGRAGFDDLYYVIDQQMKDISDQFWDIYELLIDSEGKYIQADADIATELNSQANS